ncbi:MAG: M16 family metallopeptidase [Phycisphaerae bacterium]
MEFRNTRLDNGLTVIAEVSPAAASMAVGFFVRTGSRDETPDIAGVSHFLEHMMFKGTARRTAFDVNREFDEMGAHYNAATSEENTIYFGAVLSEFQDRLVDLLGDILRPALRAEDFEVEKGVILEEIAMYQDIPRFRLYERLMAEHFAGHPLGHSVLGTPESIKALTREQMQAYFDRRYSPGNVTLTGVGKLDFDAFVAKASQMCSSWRPYDTPRELPPAPARLTRKVIPDAKVARQHIGLMSPAPATQDEDRYAAMIASAVIGDTTGSRLFYALVEKALADEASMLYEPQDGAGVFSTFISTDPDRGTQVLSIARDELKRFLDSGPTDAELTAAKNKIASSATLKGELPMGRLTAVGFDWVYRREYVPLADQIEKMLAVTRDEVLAVARKHDLSAVTVVTLGPAESL